MPLPYYAGSGLMPMPQHAERCLIGGRILEATA